MTSAPFRRRWKFLFAALTLILALGMTQTATAADFPVRIDFNPGSYGLNSGSVRIISDPAGIDCRRDCSASFPEGTEVTFTAKPDKDTFFARFVPNWPGQQFKGHGCIEDEQAPNSRHGRKTCSVVLDGPLEILPEFQMKPGSDFPGVSINGGDTYTNDPNVTLTPVWPMGATYMAFANDGGFQSSSKHDLKYQIEWRLTSSGPERLPKTVYAKFGAGGAWWPNFTDDIILDETAPVIRSVSEVGGSGSALFSRLSVPFARAGRVTLRVRASDRTSGVSRMQVGSRPSGKLKKTRFRSRVSVVAPRGRVWVRVFDRAGNASRWKVVRLG